MLNVTPLPIETVRDRTISDRRFTFKTIGFSREKLE